MQSGNQHARLSTLYTLLAGLQAGVLGGLLMLLALSLLNLRHGRSFWNAANLFATVFYGEEALRRGFRFATLSGVAFHLVVSAAFGMAFAAATQWTENRLLLRSLAIAAALAWYFTCDLWLWQRWTPFLPMYTYRVDMIAAHLLFALLLGAHPYYRRSLVIANH